MLPKLSVCMIVRNEEGMIGRCLSSVKDVADEIIVVDTGSTDKTVEIARDFQAKVKEVPWNDDFSAARNAALAEAHGEWILQIDADEELNAEDIPELRKSIADPDRVGFLLQIVNLAGETAAESVPWSFPSLRLFRNDPLYRYQGIVHEQLQIPDATRRNIGFSPVRLSHYGYLKPSLDAKEKGRRNLELIRKALEMQPNNSFNLYILGNEHFAAGDYPAAMEAYGKAYGLIQPPLPLFFPKLLRNLVSCLRELGRWQESIEAAQIAQRDFADYTDLEFLKGLNYLEHNEPDRAIEAFSKCLEKGEAPPLYDTQQGVGSWRALAGMGIAYSQKADDGNAVAFLKNALRQNPRDELTAKYLGDVLMRTRPADEARIQVEAVVDMSSGAMQATIARLFG